MPEVAVEVLMNNNDPARSAVCRQSVSITMITTEVITDALEGERFASFDTRTYEQSRRDRAQYARSNGSILYRIGTGSSMVYLSMPRWRGIQLIYASRNLYCVFCKFIKRNVKRSRERERKKRHMCNAEKHSAIKYQTCSTS